MNNLYKELSLTWKVKKINDTKGIRKCSCGTDYEVKFSDLARGWGLSCSKSCAKRKSNKRIVGTRIRYSDHPLSNMEDYYE